MMSSTEIVAGEAAAKIAGGAVAGLIVSTVMGKILGNQYSQEDENKLLELGHVYKTTLNVADIPLNWQLNDAKQPIYCYMSHRSYQKYVNSSQDENAGIKNYNYFASIMTDAMVQYLEQRKERMVGSGTRGDLIEQFFGEWLTWTLNTLPNLNYDSSAILKLEARLKYINAIDKHQNLFTNGRISRDIEKFDVINVIKNQLTACIKKAKEEKNRISSQKYFEICKQNTSGLLLECLNVIYYMRADEAYKYPLVIEDFLQLPSNERLSNIATQLFPRIKKTHSGEMLIAILLNAPNDSFDIATKTQNLKLITDYFDEEFRATEVKWNLAKSDLPEWVEPHARETQLIAIQYLCECILRLAAIYRLIKDAYTLTSGVGDSWAYGDEKGKAAIQELLFAFDAEREKLKTAFADFYQYHSTEANRYKRNQKINGTSSAFKNLNRIETAIEHIDKLCGILNSTSQDIKKQMKDYPADADKKIDGLKKYFYNNLSRFIVTYYPDRAANNSIVESQASTAANDPLNNDVSDHGLRLYKIKHLNIVIEQAKFTAYPGKSPANAKWQLGNSYDDWYQSFFASNKTFFTTYQNLLNVELVNAIKKGDIKLMQSVNLKLEKLLDNFAQKIENERPKWRFQYWIFPLTLGIPFNRKADSFAKWMFAELRQKAEGIKQYVAETIEFVQHGNVDTTAEVINAPVLKPSTTATIFKLKQRTTAQVAPLQAPSAAENPFTTWYTDFNRRLNAWQERGFEGEFKVIETGEKAQAILDNCMAYKKSLVNAALFTGTCSALQHSLNSLIVFSEKEMSAESCQQLVLVNSLLDVVIDPDDSVKRMIFNKHCNGMFANSKVNLADNYHAHGFLKSVDTTTILHTNTVEIKTNTPRS